MSKKIEYVPYYQTVLLWAYTYFLIWFNKQVAILSKYFPFSLMPEGFYLHHKNRDIMQVKNFMFRASLKTGALFGINYVDKDDNFIYYNGFFYDKPALKKINKFIGLLEKEYKKGNVFLRKETNGSVVFVNRNAIISDID